MIEVEDEEFQVPLLFHLLTSIICQRDINLQVKLAPVKTVVEEVEVLAETMGFNWQRRHGLPFAFLLLLALLWVFPGVRDYSILRLVAWQKIKILGT